ncbi:hypothetical protein I317_03765 [Kwoniella heveanensis CBS 569]|nr:hypothetical protein I317_03765 [Kwoniella heveanensis CBS 569]
MPRHQPAGSGGLGIEDELSFGSDEDLLADVGEIRISNEVPPLSSTHHAQASASSSHGAKSEKKGMFKSLGGGGGGSAVKKEKEKDKRKRTATEETVRLAPPITAPINTISSTAVGSSSHKKDKSGRHLAKSALVIDPNLESVLDLSNMAHSRASTGSSSSAGARTTGSTPSLVSSGYGKDSVSRKKGLMGALRGFGKSGGGKKEELISQRSLAQMRSRESIGTRSDISRQQSFDLTSSTFSSPRTDSSGHSHLLHQHHHALAPISMSPFQAHPPDLTTPESTIRSSTASGSMSLSKHTNTESRATQDKVIRPSLVSRSTTSSLGLPLPPPSPLSAGLSDITSVLLPTFPASVASLSSIQILSATVIRRVFFSGSSGMPDKERGGSIKSLASVLSGGANVHNAGPAASRKPMWITQQLVLTSFKVGGSTPQATPDPNEYSERSSSCRTISHLHLFNIPGSSGNPSNKSPSKSSPIGLEGEIERQMIRADSTAGVWEDDEGKRKCVMRISFGREAEGDSEWVVEMRNSEQLQEWIRQIKSIAIVVRAENEGHGAVIRDAYTSGAVRGDDLALELDMARHASLRSPTSSTSRSGSISGLSYPASNHRDSLISELSGNGPALPYLPEKVQLDRPVIDRNPSAARAESPDMLGSPAQESDDRLASHMNDLSINRSRSLYRTLDDPTATPDSSRAEFASSARTPAISRVGGSLHRHNKQGSWSSSASGGSSVARRYGGSKVPPPPAAPPPTAPLPALPNPPFQHARSIDLGEEVEFSPSFTSGKEGVEPRLSLPSPSSDDTDLALLQARQSARSSSLPTAASPDDAAKIAANKRKERLMAAFKPIPLVPELETSPRMGNGNGHGNGGTLSAISSPRADSVDIDISSPIIRPPTPPRTKSASSLSADPQHKHQVQADEETPLELYTPTGAHTSSFPLPPSTSQMTDDTIESMSVSVLSTPSTISELRPEPARYASSISSVPSMGSGTSSGRRRRERKVAVDIMSEFSETSDAQFAVDGEEEINENRPRVIRFA